MSDRTRMCRVVIVAVLAGAAPAAAVGAAA